MARKRIDAFTSPACRLQAEGREGTGGMMSEQWLTPAREKDLRIAALNNVLLRDAMEEIDRLRAQLAAVTKDRDENDDERGKLILYASKIRGRRDVHSVYEVFDWLVAERDAALQVVREKDEEVGRLRGFIAELVVDRGPLTNGDLASAERFVKDHPEFAPAPIEGEAPKPGILDLPISEGVFVEADKEPAPPAESFSPIDREIFKAGYRRGTNCTLSPEWAVIEYMRSAGLSPSSDRPRETVSIPDHVFMQHAGQGCAMCGKPKEQHPATQILRRL